MKKFFFLFLIVFILACGNNTAPDFLVINYNSSLNNSKHAFKEGDTISLKDNQIRLKSGESLLINDFQKGTVYNLLGPLSINNAMLKNNNVQSFNEKYISLLKRNIRKSDQEIRQSVMGGVYRGKNLRFNLKQNETLLSNKFVINKLDRMDCNYEVYLKDELLVECIKIEECTLDLDEYRLNDLDQYLTIHSNCGALVSELNLLLVSKTKRTKLITEEKYISDNHFPIEVMANFYLENQLYQNAINLAEKSKISSNTINRAINLINN